jgi:flagellar biosynthesis protein FlhG
VKDQAAALRAAHAGLQRDLTASDAKPVLVIASGKGGAGKSILAAGLAANYARSGQRVLLVDGAQNQGNQHVLLGVRRTAGLVQMMDGDVSPEALIHPVTEGLWLLPAESGEERLHALTSVDRARLHHRLTDLYDEFDVVIIDTGASLEDVMRVSLMGATRLLVVAIPEAAALSDAYAVIKIVTLQIPLLPIDVIVNRTLNADEGPMVFGRLDQASRRFLNHPLNYLGAVAEHASSRQLTAPHAPLTLQPEGLAEIAATLRTRETGVCP